MKRLTLTALASVAVSQAFAFNLLQNPGFETGALNPWFNARDFGGISPWAPTNFFPHTGNFCATSVGNIELRQDVAPTLGSNIVEVSFWARHPDSGGQPLAYDLFYSDSTDFESVVVTSSDVWEHFDVTADVDPTKTLVAFTVWGYLGGGSQTTYVDDALIEVVPEPVSMACLSVGILALLRRRKK